SAWRGEDTVKVSTMECRLTTPPADDARLVTMVHGLTLSGFANEAAENERRWNQLIWAARSSADADYRRCFPKHILESVAERALIGIRGMNCRVAQPSTTSTVHDILNVAWTEFWRDPVGYVDWEKGAVETLRRDCT